MENEEIISHVYQLNWHLPKKIQEEAMSVLKLIPPEKADLLIPKYGKECWENGVAILKEIGNPRNKKALPKLAALLQDRNWPGALGAIEIFREIGKERSILYIEAEVSKALELQDADWLEHLEYAIDDLGIGESHFANAVHYRKLKRLASK